MHQVKSDFRHYHANAERAQLIEEAVKPKVGDLVLVTGATGSISRAAVFAAASLGARVLAGVRGKQKPVASQLNVSGAVAIDDDAEIGSLANLDAIADTVGGPTLQKLLPKLKSGGTVGSLLGEPLGAKERGLTVRPHTAHQDRKRLARLLLAVAQGALGIPIVQRMPLDRIREAQTLTQEGVGGKVVLRVR